MNFGFRKHFLMNILDEGGGSGGGAPIEGGTPASVPAGGGTTPHVVETFTPPEWAKGLNVDQEILKSPAFKNFTSIDEVVKSHYNAQKLIGADKVVVPT